MQELIRTTDIIVISAAEAALADVGIDVLVFDGMAGQIVPGAACRLMVRDEDFIRARYALAEAGFAAELRPLRS